MFVLTISKRESTNLKFKDTVSRAFLLCMVQLVGQLQRLILTNGDGLNADVGEVDKDGW